MADNILEVDALKAYYQMSYFGVNREVRAVDGISMNVKRREVYGIAGESSSGKTSFIKVLAAAIRPPLRVIAGSASYDFGGRTTDVTVATPAEIDAIRWRHLSYIMQGSMSTLNPVRRIGKIFEDFAARPLGLSGSAFRQRVIEHLGHLKLSPSVLNAYPHELSGGMRQRVTIGLATVCKPDFIIADEPTTALDVVVQKEILLLLMEVQELMGNTILVVSHDMGVHYQVTHKMLIMYAGRVVEYGDTESVFADPQHAYTRMLIDSLPTIGDDSMRGVLASLAGAGGDRAYRVEPELIEVKPGHFMARPSESVGAAA